MTKLSVEDRHRRKVWLDAIRSIPCADCNGGFEPCCMDFDHLPGRVKKFTIMSAYGARPGPLMQLLMKLLSVK